MHSLLLDAGMILGWLALFVGVVLILAYRRSSLAVSSAALAALLAVYCTGLPAPPRRGGRSWSRSRSRFSRC